jgi:hypothetical protein
VLLVESVRCILLEPVRCMPSEFVRFIAAGPME